MQPYGEIDIVDLRDEAASTGIALEMKDQQRYFEARSGPGSKGDAAEAVDLASILRRTRLDLKDWSTNLGQLRLDKNAAEQALGGMTDDELRDHVRRLEGLEGLAKDVLEFWKKRQ